LWLGERGKDLRHEHRRSPATSGSPRVRNFQFRWGTHRYTATVAYFPGTVRLAEIFLSNGRAGSDVDAAAKDSAVVASIAFQHGVPVETVRKALLRDPRRVASSPLGRALDMLVVRP
jgi:hypothetical protein